MRKDTRQRFAAIAARPALRHAALSHAVDVHACRACRAIIVYARRDARLRDARPLERSTYYARLSESKDTAMMAQCASAYDARM